MINEDGRDDVARRRHALLLAVVDDFVKTAEPVGSHHLASRYALGVKAATIRAMMAELERENYLYQPYTSAGRIPTDKGFRYYVDHLRPSWRISQQDKTHIEYHYSARERDVGALLRDTGHLLALLSGQVAVVVTPRFEAIELAEVALTRLRQRQVLALFVAAGAIHQRVIETERDYSSEELQRMAVYLNRIVEGRTLEDARALIETALGEEGGGYDRFVREALRLGEAVVSGPVPVDVLVEGGAKVVHQPEFDDPGRLRQLIEAMEDKSTLLGLLENTLEDESVDVSIGSEHAPRLSDLSMVGAPYRHGSAPVGALAVLGPVRMDYGRVIALVDYTARALSRALQS
jgi:heat-inducible transcriptional repressor